MCHVKLGCSSLTSDSWSLSAFHKFSKGGKTLEGMLINFWNTACNPPTANEPESVINKTAWPRLWPWSYLWRWSYGSVFTLLIVQRRLATTCCHHFISIRRGGRSLLETALRWAGPIDNNQKRRGKKQKKEILIHTVLLLHVQQSWNLNTKVHMLVQLHQHFPIRQGQPCIHNCPHLLWNTQTSLKYHHKV